MNETDEECEEGEETTPSGFGGGGVAKSFFCVNPCPSLFERQLLFRIETFDWLKPVSIKIRRSERSRDMVGFQSITQRYSGFLGTVKMASIYMGF
jgi:hypothetical protein